MLVAKRSLAVAKLWKEFHGEWYGFFTSNCQNFASLLFMAVAMKIPDDEKTLWEELPDPVVHTLANVSKVSFAGQIVWATWTAGVAAMSAADALAVGAATAAMATQAPAIGAAVTTTGAQAGIVGVAGSQAGAAGSAGSQAGAVGATGSQAGLAGTAGTTQAGAVATGSTQAGAGTAAAGSTQASTATTATTAKGSTAAGKAGAAAGKAGGVGAKFAAVSHGALGKGALVAGKGLAVVNPAAAIGGIAATTYLHRRYKKQKSFQKRLQRHDDSDKDEPFSIEQMLADENKLFGEAMKEPDDADGDFENELCESLELTHVSTEPAEMPDQESIIQGDVSTGQDERRHQTLA